jgi:hypothetical protein
VNEQLRPGISAERTLDRGKARLPANFVGCTTYLDNGRLAVVLRHRRSPRLRRPFPVVALDPTTIEVDAPQKYEGFVPFAPLAAWGCDALKVRIDAA